MVADPNDPNCCQAPQCSNVTAGVQGSITGSGHPPTVNSKYRNSWPCVQYSQSLFLHKCLLAWFGNTGSLPGWRSCDDLIDVNVIKCMNFIEKRLKNQNKFELKEKSIFFLQICVITRDPYISKDRDGGMAALMTVCVMMPTLADTLAMTCKDSRIYKLWFFLFRVWMILLFVHWCYFSCKRFPSLPSSCRLEIDPANPCCRKPNCVNPTPAPGMTPTPPLTGKSNLSFVKWWSVQRMASGLSINQNYQGINQVTKIWCMHYQENYHYHGYASIFVWQKKIILYTGKICPCLIFCPFYSQCYWQI